MASHDGGQRDAGVGPERRILGRDHGVRHRLGDLGVRDRITVLDAEGAELLLPSAKYRWLLTVRKSAFGSGIGVVTHR